jgi:hypothetical protein
MLCLRLILMTILIMSTLACKRRDPNPEFRDPIYRFLLEQSTGLKSSLESEFKKVEEAEKAYAKTEPLTHERKLALRDLESSRRLIAIAHQQIDYLDIRTERRRVESRRSYKIAFDADKDWPDPKEFEYFMAEHRLRTAPRKWDARVPRLQDRILAAWPKPDPKAKKQEEAQAPEEE